MTQKKVLGSVVEKKNDPTRNGMKKIIVAVAMIAAVSGCVIESRPVSLCVNGTSKSYARLEVTRLVKEVGIVTETVYEVDGRRFGSLDEVMNYLREGGNSLDDSACRPSNRTNQTEANNNIGPEANPSALIAIAAMFGVIALGGSGGGGSGGELDP